MEYSADKTQIRRYLGIPCRADELTEALIDQCISELLSCIRPKYTYKKFKIEETNGSFVLNEANLRLTGETAFSYLHSCTYCYILGATLGIEADNKIRIAQRSNMAKAVVYDACATELIENVCDVAQSEIAEAVKADGLSVTRRFSPGYGDLPIVLQKDICSILHSDTRLGLTLTNKLLLIPTKSVTALIGAGSSPNKCSDGCNICTMRKTCKYSKEK